MNEMIGELFSPIDMPEPPKESFFKGLFGGGTRNLDREELCEYFIYLFPLKLNENATEFKQKPHPFTQLFSR